MNKIIAIGLIILSLGLGYMGINKINNSTVGIEIGELEISAGDESGKTTGYIYLGLAVAALVVGGGMIGRKS